MPLLMYGHHVLESLGIALGVSTYNGDKNYDPTGSVLSSGVDWRSLD
jgi:hypothetical protein